MTIRAESPIQLRACLPVGKVRADALPEHTRYRDDGCDVHPSCLTCPLPRCRYDEPGGLRALLNARRDHEIVEMRLRGVPVDDLASRFGVSRRTVFRVLSAPPGAGRDGRHPNGRRVRTATSYGATLIPLHLRRREARHA